MTDASPEPTVVSSVYVHAPFCARRCNYCDFAVSVRRQGDVDGWAEAIWAELDLVERDGTVALADRLHTLYVGGGTPTLLGAGAMEPLVRMFGSDRLSLVDLEWTAEANPESFTPELAAAWVEAGVNRLSLGLQTFHEDALRWMGRLHGAARPLEALRIARGVGLTNVSVDLIFGLPGALGRSWPDDVERVLGLEVPHVSLYGLTVESGTPLGRAVREGRESPVDEEQYRDEFLYASEALRGAGYVQYEVSNFALPGMEARHNAVYWSGTPYLGLGNGAHSFAPPFRFWNVRSWEEYRTLVTSGESPEVERERLDAGAESLERAWLGLRTSRGVALPPDRPEVADLAAAWIDEGLAEAEAGRLRLTPEGWLLLDRLAVDLDRAMGVAAAPAGFATSRAAGQVLPGSGM